MSFVLKCKISGFARQIKKMKLMPPRPSLLYQTGIILRSSTFMISTNKVGVFICSRMSN